jgi:hypothetical protein
MPPASRSGDNFELPQLSDEKNGVDVWLIPGALGVIAIGTIRFFGDWAAADGRVAIWTYFAIAAIVIVSAGWGYYSRKTRRTVSAAFSVGAMLVALLCATYFFAAARDEQVVVTAAKKDSEARATVRREAEVRRRGILRPADLPPPKPPKLFDPSVVPANAILLYFGNHSVSWGVGDSFVVMRHSGTVDLVLKRVDGGVTLDSCFFDRSGKQIGKMFDGEFAFSDEDPLLTVHQPEDHILVVRDNSNERVLEVRFLNPTTLQVLANFRTTDGGHIRINDNEFLIDTESIHNSRMSGLVAGDTLGRGPAVLQFLPDGKLQMGPLPQTPQPLERSCQ